ncbi:MAG: tetratricopeptide repeat protein [Desulfobacterales bacterium]|jgi:Tfp pilus assembly protein PilF
MEVEMNTDINEVYSDGMAAFVGQDYSACIDHLTEVLRLDNTHKLALVSRGAAFMRTGNHKTAIVDFDRVIAIDPDYARAYHLRGLAREIEGDDKGALDDFNRAIALKPDYGAAYHSRATLHTKMGQMDDAAEDIRMVTHLTQQNIETFANENNVWRSNHMHLESILETELNR